MTTPDEREAMRGALIWNERLRALGIPLPEVIHSDLDYEFPYLILERLSGCDLGFEIRNFRESSLRELARQIVGFQKKVGVLFTKNRFGYAIEAEQAPFGSWKEVLTQSIDRSRKRIRRAGVVSEKCSDKVEKLVSDCGKLLDEVRATPFLHDITTKNVIVANERLSGIVDVDNLCFGDPLFHIALTRMALLSDRNDTAYVDFLLKEHGSYSSELLRLYTVECCVGFLSEIGQTFNGNPVVSSKERREHLELVMDSILKS